MKYSWTQSVCFTCWKIRNPERTPLTMRDAVREKCCYCGESTTAGIYVRIDPTTVTYPALKED